MSALFASWVSSQYMNTLEGYKKQFASAKPFPHVVLPHFLHEDRARELLKALQTSTFVHKESDLFSLWQTGDLSTSSHPSLKGFHLLAASRAFAQFMEGLTGISVKSGALDLAGSLYKPGDYLLCHDDQVEDRKIAYILYLSKDFSEKDGASFMLFNHSQGEPSTLAQKHLPLFNHLMVFEVSNVSFHAVEENMGTKDRYAIGGWLH